MVSSPPQRRHPWLTPSAVLSILIVNIDNVAPTEYATVFESAGLDQVSYSPSTSTLSASSWPTLGEMIDDGKRLVTFLDNQADTSSVSYLVDGQCISFCQMSDDS